MGNTLTFHAPNFIWHGTYDSRDLPKQAGLRWDRDRKHWYTTDAALASRLRDYADSAAQAAFAPATETLEASRAATLEADTGIPCPEGLAYLPYQRAGIVYAANRPATLIADEMGLGKTIQALGVANVMDAQTILIICPASLRLNWLRESQTWLCREHTYHVVEGGNDLPPGDATVIIVNYDVLQRPALHQALMARSYDLLIVDEA